MKGGYLLKKKIVRGEVVLVVGIRAFMQKYQERVVLYVRK